MAIRVFEGENVWQVGVSLPRDESKGRRYALTRTVAVIASTADRAIECVREHYGECNVWSVQHRANSDTSLVVAAEVLDDAKEGRCPET